MQLYYPESVLKKITGRNGFIDLSGCPIIIVRKENYCAQEGKRMHPDQLDTILRTLSDTEIGYKNGTRNPAWAPEVLSGEVIPCLSLRGMSAGEYITRRPSASFYIVIPELNISVNRNSRYCPVPTHTHDYVEISYIYSGAAKEIILDTELTIREGQVLIIDTHTPHSVGILKEQDVMVNLLMTREYLHDTLFHHLSRDSILSDFFVNVLTEKNTHNSYLLFPSQNNRRVSMFFKELLCEFCDPSINSTDIITSLITLIIAELINVYDGEHAMRELRTSNASFIPILHYMEANFRTCTRESVADFFHINEKHLTNLIRENTGKTYKQLIQTQKLRYAAKLLKNTNMIISDVVTECGYENVNFFYKKFREEYGMNPKEYRESI